MDIYKDLADLYYQLKATVNPNKEDALSERDKLMTDMANKSDDNAYRYRFPELSKLYTKPGYDAFKKADDRANNGKSYMAGGYPWIKKQETDEILSNIYKLAEDNKYRGKVNNPLQYKYTSKNSNDGIFIDDLLNPAIAKDFKSDSMEDLFSKLKSMYTTNPDVGFIREPLFDNTAVQGVYRPTENKIHFPNVSFYQKNIPSNAAMNLVHEKLHSDQSKDGQGRSSLTLDDNGPKIDRLTQQRDHFMGTPYIPETYLLKHLREALEKDGKTGVTDEMLQRLKELSYY